jgi:hypothetical protein
MPMSEAQGQHNAETLTLRPWKWLRQAAVIGAVLYLVIHLASQSTAVTPLLTPLALLQWISAAALLVGRIEASEHGIRTRSIWLGRRSLSWSKIVRVHFLAQLGVAVRGPGLFAIHLIPLHYGNKAAFGFLASARVDSRLFSPEACTLLGMPSVAQSRQWVRNRPKGNLTLWLAWLGCVILAPWLIAIQALATK